jgi:hypothetical protein
MPNGFKYSTDTQSLALKKGNFYIATGDVGKGPTSTSGFYNGITPPPGGYTIYLNKESGGPSIYVAYNDTELISLTNKIAGASYSTVNECLNYFTGQSDKLVTNGQSAAIITNGLVLNLDASFAPSYPKNGTTWYDISSGNYNATLYNGTTYNSDNGGIIVFDNTDDYCSLPNSLGYSTDALSVFSWYKSNGQPLGNYHIICGGQELEISIPWPGGALRTGIYTSTRFVSNHGSGLNDGNWHYIGFTFNGSIKTSYIDGVNVGTQSITSGTLVTSFTNRNIGKFGSSNTYYANGNMGSYTVYNKSLTDLEVLQNYNATSFLGSQYNPANSAADILSANPSATDGYYWINTSLGPRQLYCIMSLGGWMGVTSEISPQINNLSTTTTWETNTNRRLQSGNSQILNVSLVEAACNTPTHYQLQSPNSVGISYTQTMLLIQRITTIGQCSSISGVVANGYYSGPEYSGTYTSNGMCLWGDGIFANACCSAQNVSGLQPYWVMFGSGANQSLRYEVRCAGGSGQHYHMWFVK